MDRITVWERLAQARQARESLGWWRRQLGDGFEALRPYLRACAGVRAKVYPCPETGILLPVRESRCPGGYVAYAAGDDADCVDDVELSWEDVQAWSLDTRALGACIRDTLDLEFAPGAVQSYGAECCEEIGWCRRHGGRRRVAWCAAGDAVSTLDAARSAAAAGVGCLLVPARHPGVHELLAARGAAELPMADCLRTEGGRISGGCNEACAMLVSFLVMNDGLEKEYGRSPRASPTRTPSLSKHTLRKRGAKTMRGSEGRKTMELWAIRFEGSEFDLPDVVGSCYLAYLLMHPDRLESLSAAQIIQAVSGVQVSGSILSEVLAKSETFDSEGMLQMALRWEPDERQEILDGEQIGNFRKMINLLRRDLDEASRDPSRSGEVDALRRKKEELEDFLTRSTRPGKNGRRLPKQFGSGSAAKQPNLVRKHMGKVLGYIREQDRALFEHLNDRETLRYGEQNYYRPQRGISWQIVS